jgi:NADH:ubiquinone oxidoreductase subunit 3 (subunit A)
MDILLSPPIAFLLYIPLVLLILLLGRSLAPRDQQSETKTSIYGSGELAPTHIAAPGYRPFVVIAFFFAILHLGMLILGTGSLTWISGLYIVGLMLTLIALILG